MFPYIVFFCFYFFKFKFHINFIWNLSSSKKILYKLNPGINRSLLIYVIHRANIVRYIILLLFQFLHTIIRVCYLFVCILLLLCLHKYCILSYDISINVYNMLMWACVAVRVICSEVLCEIRVVFISWIIRYNMWTWKLW